MIHSTTKPSNIYPVSPQTIGAQGSSAIIKSADYSVGIITTTKYSVTNGPTAMTAGTPLPMRTGSSTWNEQFKTFTKRDQLSINVSSIISGVHIGTISGENDSSEWHEWPVPSNRKTEMRDTTSGRNFRKLRIIANALRYGHRFYRPL